jgi:hypothetical protein
MRVGVEATTGASLRWPTALAAGAYFWRVAPWSGACGVGRGPVWSLRVTARDVDLPSAWSFGDDVDADGRDDAVLPRQGVAWLGDGRLVRFRADLHPVQDLDGDGYPDWALPLADLFTTEVYAGGADGPGARLLARLTTRVIGEAFGAGDLNAETDSDEIRYLRGYTGLGGECVFFNDCFAAAGDGSPGHTFCARNPGAAASREPDRRIDYVFVRGPNDRLQGVPLEARVCLDEPVDGVWASDHFAVFSRIEL